MAWCCFCGIERVVVLGGGYFMWLDFGLGVVSTVGVSMNFLGR